MRSHLQTDTKKCYLCGKGGELHPHHIFNGAFKKKSEKYGYVIYVHNLPCHRLIHDTPGRAIELKKLAQMDFEREHSHEEYMEIFKKNYL